MEFKDVMEIHPKSFMWRTPSPASYKPDYNTDASFFKWDYKISYKNSPYYIRNKISPSIGKNTIYHSINFDQNDVKHYSNLIPEFESIIYKFRNL
jgi:hypothetical protein